MAGSSPMSKVGTGLAIAFPVVGVPLLLANQLFKGSGGGGHPSAPAMTGGGVKAPPIGMSGGTPPVATPQLASQGGASAMGAGNRDQLSQILYGMGGR